NSQSPYPSLAAGGCHAVAPSGTSGARMRRKNRKATEERRASQNSMLQRQSAAPERPATNKQNRPDIKSGRLSQLLS
ncbi:MAG: hypothetical protein ACI4L8_04950, partial [Candidatus Fimadaptatus sp.]